MGFACRGRRSRRYPAQVDEWVGLAESRRQRVTEPARRRHGGSEREPEPHEVGDSGRVRIPDGPNDFGFVLGKRVPATRRKGVGRVGDRGRFDVARENVFGVPVVGRARIHAGSGGVDGPGGHPLVRAHAFGPGRLPHELTRLAQGF